MFAKLVTIYVALFLTATYAAVDVNHASEAELDGIKGIGPPISRVIIAEREKAEFRNWTDFIARVKGAGPKSAARFSAQGLLVAGLPYQAKPESDSKQRTKNSRATSDLPPATPTAP